MAMRVALGAGRFRLVCQVLTEALLISGTGTLLGVFLAYFGAGALVRIITSGRRIIGLPQQIEIPLQPDGHVLLFNAGNGEGWRDKIPETFRKESRGRASSLVGGVAERRLYVYSPSLESRAS